MKISLLVYSCNTSSRCRWPISSARPNLWRLMNTSPFSQHLSSLKSQDSNKLYGLITLHCCKCTTSLQEDHRNILHILSRPAKTEGGFFMCACIPDLLTLSSPSPKRPRLSDSTALSYAEPQSVSSHTNGGSRNYTPSPTISLASLTPAPTPAEGQQAMDEGQPSSSRPVTVAMLRALTNDLKRKYIKPSS